MGQTQYPACLDTQGMFFRDEEMLKWILAFVHDTLTTTSNKEIVLQDFPEIMKLSLQNF